MDDIYLIEIRLSRTKWRIRETIITIGQIFSLEPYLERHPHVTLFGPLTLNEGVSPRQLLDTIATIADVYDPISFTLDSLGDAGGNAWQCNCNPGQTIRSLKKTHLFSG